MKLSKVIALLIAVLALLWIGSGLLKSSDPAAQEVASTRDTSAQAPKIMEVRVKDSLAATYFDDVMVTGRTQASRKVEMKAETDGQIQVLPQEEGDTVTTGTVLAELELRDRTARVREAQERVTQREIEHNASRKLQDKGFNSKVRVAQTLADLENARAALKQAQVDETKTRIVAPFDGILTGQQVEIGDYLIAGDALFSIVDLDPIEFVGYISERRIQDIALGGKAVAVFLDGRHLEGQVSYISPAADPQTRTFKIVVTAPNGAHTLKEGLTAKIQIPVASKKAHKISPSILALDDNGQLGVKIVETGDKVKFMPVVIVSDEPKAMWVTGLPEKVRIITVGQEFVTDGQVVTPVRAESSGML